MSFDEESVRRTLQKLGEGTTIEFRSEGPFTYILVVYSPSFTGLNDAERQANIWRLLQKELGDEPMRSIEYIFTVSPDEQAA